jgi:poly-gamma-glutamate synthesis protein (capsule biosynthesis protein)
MKQLSKDFSENMSKKTFTVTIVSDIMQHDRQHESEKQRNFTYENVISKEIVELFQSSDIVVGNLETIISSNPCQGFPKFSAPLEFAKLLRDSGIDIVCTANNHSLDWGWNQLSQSAANCISAGLLQVGTFSNKHTFRIPETDMKLTVHNCTDIVNGLQELPKGSILACNADDMYPTFGFNIAICHVGKEYSTEPTERQLEIIDKLFERGFDAVLCQHSHVIGDNWLFRKNRQMRKLYATVGMGNFISDQESLDRQLGQITTLEFDKFGIISITNRQCETIWVDGNQKVILLDEIHRL